MGRDDKRLIEDYLPIEAISAEASREKSVRKGHISTLHLWWARRPLVACRAAVYGALVPAAQFIPNGAQTDEKKRSLGRANAAKFVKALCQYPGSPHFISEAQHHILNAHAERLTREISDWKALRTAKPAWMEEFKFSGERVSVEDISAGRAPRPRVLDMFAGGGAIPLEALRLGCEAYAVELNPVAHIIELCTLVYPQKYGKPDPNTRGMTGPKNAKDETTWGGLAEEVRYWGEWVLRKVKAEIGDLYPLIPDPEFKGKRSQIQPNWFKEHDEAPLGYLIPVAYLWTRTVQCKNPACKATVPLVRQTWLCKKSGRYVALQPHKSAQNKLVKFEVREATSEKGIGFDPTAFSSEGNSTCPFCNTVADSDYIKAEGRAGRLGLQQMATVAHRRGSKGKVYLSVGSSPATDAPVTQKLIHIAETKGLQPPDEPVPSQDSFTCKTHLYGLTRWRDLFVDRQLAALLAFAATVQDAVGQLQASYAAQEERAKVIVTYLGLMVSRTANFCSAQCLWNYTGGRGVVHSFAHQALPITWDFPESNPLYEEAAGWSASLQAAIDVIGNLPTENPAIVERGDARRLSHSQLLDAVITDPPYYDNISYGNLSDFFYVWLRRAIGPVLGEHFASQLTPKKSEIIAETSRHNGDRQAARRWFEENLAASFEQASNMLKPEGIFVCVYAHKTTLGWVTLIDALRRASLIVTESWPLDTERPGGMKVDKAMLASSIFLVARKRELSASVGDYDQKVRPELSAIVSERVETLWEMGISGADLVIACVGAGLRAFTRFARVEYANGEEVPAGRFLTEVETVVLDTILQKLSKVAGGNGSRSRSLAGLDSATRFYVLWRYTYAATELDAGEAIIFATGTHVELDGPLGLSTGSRALVEKKKGKYKLRDFAARGDDDRLGVPDEDTAESRATIDVLHRLLWLLENRPPLIPDFIADAQPNLDQLRLVAQALAGPALKGGELESVSPSAEQSGLSKLLANRSTVMEGKAATQDRRAGQQQLRLG